MVSSGTREEGGTAGLCFVIQGKKRPHELDGRIEAFLYEFKQKLNEV